MNGFLYVDCQVSDLNIPEKSLFSVNQYREERLGGCHQQPTLCSWGVARHHRVCDLSPVLGCMLPFLMSGDRQSRLVWRMELLSMR